MKTRILLFLLTLVLTIIFTQGCHDPKNTSKAEQAQTEATNKILDEINREIGLPDLKNFQQKRTLKMIMEMCDQTDLICYAYLKSEYTGKLTFLGKCVGFGVPFSAQYTNPYKLQAFDLPGTWHYELIPQADPNGLYMPTSSSATWLLMVNPKTQEVQPAYIEPEIVVSPFPLSGNILE